MAAFKEEKEGKQSEPSWGNKRKHDGVSGCKSSPLESCGFTLSLAKLEREK